MQTDFSSLASTRNFWSSDEGPTIHKGALKKRFWRFLQYHSSTSQFSRQSVPLASMGWRFSSVSWLIFSFLHLLTCTAEDRITLGQSIGANQTITSSNDLFALGFFSPYNSTNRYVGIWYNQIPNQTVIWVANKEKPLTDPNGVLTITDDGNLVVLDGYRKIIWSSKVTMVTENSIMAVLMDTGNLILRQTDQKVVWQSFDSPHGSSLPGMRLSLNKKTGENIRLLSWKDVNDPAIGQYSCGIDPRTHHQVIIWKGPDMYMRGDVWQEAITVAIKLEGDRQFVGYVARVVNNDEISVQFTISDNLIMVRYVLTPTGILQMQEWRENSKEWIILMSVPTNECNLYTQCGPFASCDNSSLPLLCKCLKGFEPKIQKDWDSGNWSGGCVRRKQLDCEKGDEFLKVERMKLPDFSISTDGIVSRRECELACLRNCSCTAYAYNNSTGGVDWKCLIWVGDLIDLVGNRVGTVDLYMRLAAAELGIDGQVIGSSKARSLLAILLSSAAAAMLLLGTSGYLLRRRRGKNGRRETKKPFPMHGFISAETQYEEHNMLQSGTNISELPLVDFDRIIAATDNFSPENKLGVGGFGSVYKGKFLGQEAAVKRLSKSSGQGLEEFKNEVELIAKLQHRNLVKLLGWCMYGEEKILIYEYMPNNSLDKYLFDPSRQPHLDWGVRFRIVEGIAQGLLYLHRYSRLRVIHRDLKASNVLLDSEMNAKISDFGLARIFGGNQTQGNTGRVVGTFGYMSPEYAVQGVFSEKSDVFSFGVLLLEIISGKRSSGFWPHEQWSNLLGYAWQLWNEGRGLELMDRLVSDSHVAHEVDRCIHVGLLCVQENPTDRPTMPSIVLMLGNESARPPSPKPPAFLTWKSPTAADPSLDNSVNQLTISTIEPRT